MSLPPQPRVGPLKIRADRVIYTTITLMAVLIVYDDIDPPKLVTVHARTTVTRASSPDGAGRTAPGSGTSTPASRAPMRRHSGG